MGVRIVPALGVGMLVALVAGCHEPPPPAAPARSLLPQVRAVAPQVRDLTYTVVQPGYVEAYEQTSLYAKVSGFIKSFAVDIGQQVKQGDVLAEIFVPELEEELQRKQAQVELDQQDIEHAGTLVQVAESDLQTHVAQLQEAQADVGRFQAEVVRWESESKRLTQLLQERVVDRQVLDESQKQLDSAKSARDAAQAAVAARAAEKLAAEAAVAKAKIDVRVAEAKVKVSQADARQTAALVGYTKVTAPYDAVVTARNANTGDYVEAASGDRSSSRGVPLFVVARTDMFRLFVDVPEAYADYVRVGTKAVVRAEALSGLEIATQIARTSWSLDQKTRTLRTEIDLGADKYDGLRPGMYFYGSILIELPGVRVVPQDALQVQGNETYCFLLANDRAVRVSVQPGLSDGTWVQVVKKKSGREWSEWTGEERVIVGDLTELADGQQVQVVHEATPPANAPSRN